MSCRLDEHLLNESEALQTSLCRHMRYSLGKNLDKLSNRDLYLALTLSLRDRLLDRMLRTSSKVKKEGAKRVYYLSLEFLIGRSLGNNLYNLGVFDTYREIFEELGVDLQEIRDQERDAALGNGGLGRLAACFLDSMATLGIPGYGYGLHYDYGLFQQEIQDGYQKERPDHWASEWTPLQVERSDEACLVPVYGRIEHARTRDGEYNPMWMDWKVIKGVPYDIPVAGYGGETVNYLRLYSARPSTEFDIEIFNTGDYFRAVEQKMATETISRVLYPNDTVDSGKELRLLQEYFLVACSLRDILTTFFSEYDDPTLLPDKVAIQLNDTHPALAVAELMRLLVDEHGIEWDQAWDLTRNTLAYTNHTLLPEALETWSVSLLEKVLPRHMQLIFEINHRFLQETAALHPGDDELLERLSLIDENGGKQVRMAHLAIVGSHSVNGVSALHTDLLKQFVFRDFHKLYPGRINNKTNGVTPRRWLLKANPELSGLITEALGDQWITDLDRLQELRSLTGDKPFLERFLQAKTARKAHLAEVIRERTGIQVVPEALFDIQAKRIHEYKRQLLNVLFVMHTYLRMVDHGEFPTEPRVSIFAGKAAPGYRAAKQLIKLVHCVADTVNRDPRTRGLLKVVFLPDYSVSLAESIIPGADLSEQISTAGFEASGTGNMKFALNGAMTIGTLDGANVEMCEAVGEDNMYIFGLTTEQVHELHRPGAYAPWARIAENPALTELFRAVDENRFSKESPGVFTDLFNELRHQDRYLLLADFEDYVQTQRRVMEEFGDKELWARKTLLNVAGMGFFSSDRTISQYAKEIWGINNFSSVQ